MQGQTVLLDTSTPKMKMILIEGGELIFDEANVELNAENILITNGGLLQVLDVLFQFNMELAHCAVICFYSGFFYRSRRKILNSFNSTRAIISTL